MSNASLVADALLLILLLFTLSVFGLGMFGVVTEHVATRVMVLSVANMVYVSEVVKE